MGTVALAVAGCAVVLLALGLRRDTRIEEDWSLVLSPEAGRAYAALQETLAGEGRALAWSHERAAAARDVEPEEAMRLLGVGYDYLAVLIPDRLRLLQALATYSRMVSGLAPAPAAQVRLFTLRRTARALLLSATRARGSWEQATAAQRRLEAWGMELERLLLAISKSG